MKKIQLLVLAMAVALVPGMASATLIAALDFTGGGSAWNITVTDPGYAVTFELDGDSTKAGYEASGLTGAVRLYQEVFSPGGLDMSNITVEAVLSGYSSWVALPRIGLSGAEGDPVATLTYYSNVEGQGSDGLPGGVVYDDEPVIIDATGVSAYTDITSFWLGVELFKGIGAFTPVNISAINVYADVVPEPTSLALLALGAMAFVRRRFV
jgi:hypothetical protein